MLAGSECPAVDRAAHDRRSAHRFLASKGVAAHSSPGRVSCRRTGKRPREPFDEERHYGSRSCTRCNRGSRQVSGESRSGDPRKRAAAEGAVHKQRNPAREPSTWFIFLAWAVFFVVWAVAGSLLAAAIVLGVMLSAGMGVLKAM